MAVDLRGHPMFAATGFNAPTRFGTAAVQRVQPQEPALDSKPIDRREFIGRIAVSASGGLVRNRAGVTAALCLLAAACASPRTEAPDETAQGEWLNLVTKPGFSYVMAHLKYLRDGHYTVERVEEDGGAQQRDSTSITLLRVRPVLPGRSTSGTTTSTSGTGTRR